MKYKDFIKKCSKIIISSNNERHIITEKLHIDQSALNIDNRLFKEYENYAESNNFVEKFDDLINGKRKNITENRSVTHFNYRNVVSNLYEPSLEKMEEFSKEIKNKFKKVIIFGIGGSHLGPRLMEDIFSSSELEIHFITGSDPEEYEKYYKEDLSGYAFIIASKSFCTIETLTSYTTITENKFFHQTYAITSMIEKAEDFGIGIKNIAEIDIGTGGRFSIWSAINLGLFLRLGRSGFESFLTGGKTIDNLSNLEASNNPALSLAIQDLVMNNLLNMDTTLILSYDYKLRNFSAYAQQLEMESLGKSVDRDTGELLPYQTGSIVWGGYGPRSQHSFFQHLFQGTIEANTYFIASKTDQLNFKQFKGQTKSLISGNEAELNPHKKVNKRKFTSIVLEDLSAESLGQLIAIWENKTIFMSMFWNINPFDQWGVELGKLNTKKEIE